MAEWLKGNNNLVRGSSVRLLVICQLEQLKPKVNSLLICQGWFQKAMLLSGKPVDQPVNNSVLCTQLRDEKSISDAWRAPGYEEEWRGARMMVCTGKPVELTQVYGETFGLTFRWFITVVGIRLQPWWCKDVSEERFARAGYQLV